ncbi:zf-TFIIB domain-containing protein [Microbulbifer sp. TYP-18]|uniref:TFIIB-type zinc ribbon-containing protein n=1 Tax=Microbulbifer sp. TYP-18 TaxID=3230024 RepID=UPI0034C5E78F
MLCPACKDSGMLSEIRSGIEIDYCPKCRGVWLDRGELDKLVERSRGEMPLPTPAKAIAEAEATPLAQKKRRNLITELFDF